MKDIYVNLPIKDIVQAAKLWLNRNISDMKIIGQIIHMLQTIIE